MSYQVPNLNPNPSLAEKAKAAEDAALLQFDEKVVQLSKVFSIKETARLMRVSTGYLRARTNEQGVTFADRENRTPAEKRKVKKLWDHYMIHYDLRQVEAPIPPVQPGELTITPGLELKSRKAWFTRRNVFFERCCELAELFTIAEAAEILKVSHRFLKTFAYNEQVTFVGEPSLDVKNDFYVRAEKLAAEAAPIEKAAKALSVTTRFLTGYAKNWNLPFTLACEPSLDVKNEFYTRAEKLAEEAAPIEQAAKVLSVTTRFLTVYARKWNLPFELSESAVANAGEVDAVGDDDFDMSFMEDLIADDDLDEEPAVPDCDSEDSPMVTSLYFERPTAKTAVGSTYAVI